MAFSKTQIDRLGERLKAGLVSETDHPVEIQVRTELQHRWAEVSEKYSDAIDPAIKYGCGDSGIQNLLARASSDIAQHTGQTR